MTQFHPDGWYPDPWGTWPERYYQRGYYTDRVRSGPTEARDPKSQPPPGAPVGYTPGPPSGPPGYGYPPAPVAGGYGSGYPPGYGYSPYGAGYGPSGYGPSAWLPKAGSALTGPLPLHPMSVGDILDGAFRLIRANIKTIAIIVVILSGPVQLLSALAQRNANGGRSLFSVFGNQSGSSGNSQTSLSWPFWIALLVGFLVQPYVAGAISRVVAASYLGHSETPGVALRDCLSRFFPLLLGSVMVHLLELVGTILLVLPGLLFMSLCVCVAPAIVMERLGPVAGISRSWQLNRSRIWRVLGIALLSGLLVSLVGNAVVLPFSVLAVSMGLHWGFIVLFLGSMISALVRLSLTAVIATLIYFDGRIRYEGLDLQILAGGVSPH